VNKGKEGSRLPSRVITRGQAARRVRTRDKPRGLTPAAQALLQERDQRLLRPREPVVRRRLLVLEENRHSIDELRDAFTQEGYECEVALDLATARTVLGGRLMDAAVINVSLTGINDEEVIREFKSLNRAMSLVVYNGVKDRARQRRMRALGADSYLSAPSDLKAVEKAVKKVLERGK